MGHPNPSTPEHPKGNDASCDFQSCTDLLHNQDFYYRTVCILAACAIYQTVLPLILSARLFSQSEDNVVHHSRYCFYCSCPHITIFCYNLSMHSGRKVLEPSYAWAMHRSETTSIRIWRYKRARRSLCSDLANTLHMGPQSENGPKAQNFGDFQYGNTVRSPSSSSKILRLILANSACAASIIRLAMTPTIFTDMDTTWNLSQIGIWA